MPKNGSGSQRFTARRAFFIDSMNFWNSARTFGAKPVGNHKEYKRWRSKQKNLAKQRRHTGAEQNALSSAVTKGMNGPKPS